MLGISFRRELGRLHAGYEELEELLRLEEGALRAAAPEVSSWGVARQVSHAFLVNGAVFANIRKALRDDLEGSPPGGRPTRLGRLVLLCGWIPRGRGRAPEGVVPPESPGREDLLAALRASREELREVEELATSEAARPRLRHGRRRHFAFGELNALQWLRFARIHTRHHLRIIEDIRRRARER